MIGSSTINRVLNEETRKRISKHVAKGKKELKRAAPPWGLIILGALVVGFAVSCIAHAIVH